MTRQCRLAAAVAAVLGMAGAMSALAEPTGADPGISAPKTEQTVFSKEAAEEIKQRSAAQAASSPALDAAEGQNVNFANSNTRSSNRIFQQRLGEYNGPALAQAQGQGAAAAPAAQQPSSPAVSGNDKEIAELRQQLAEARKQVKDIEDTYGKMPAGADGSPMPESQKALVPSVPASVLSRTLGGTESTNILVTPGVNQLLTISSDQPNRIVTPFNHPQILSSALQGGSGDKCGEVCVKGSVIYISTKKDYPLGMFVTEKGNEQTAVSLTLVPRRIPPREVRLQIADGAGAMLMAGSDEAKVWETQQPFVSGVKKAMKDIALGQVPNGYHLQKIPSDYKLPVCTQPGLSFDFKKGELIAGANLNYVIGKITNVAKKEIEFVESSCGGYDVAAVAAYPYNLLRPGESTEVYVVQRSGSGQAQAAAKRRSLIQR